MAYIVFTRDMTTLLFDPQEVRTLDYDTALPLVLEALQTPHIRFSYKDYQTPGVDCICLQRTEELMVNLYVCDPQRLKPTCKEYLVPPREANCNFKVMVLEGKVTFSQFATGVGVTWYNYCADMDLKGSIWNQPIAYSKSQLVFLEEATRCDIVKGGGVFSTSKIVTAMSADPERQTVFLGLHHSTVLKKKCLNYYVDKKDCVENVGVAYEKFEMEEFQNLVQKTIELVQLETRDAKRSKK